MEPGPSGEEPILRAPAESDSLSPLGGDPDVQVRANGRVTVHHDDKVTRAAWAAIICDRPCGEGEREAPARPAADGPGEGRGPLEGGRPWRGQAGPPAWEEMKRVRLVTILTGSGCLGARGPEGRAAMVGYGGRAIE